MNGWDIALLIVIAAAVFFALRQLIRTRRSGGCSCGGGCASCGGSCGSCAGCGGCKGKKSS